MASLVFYIINSFHPLMLFCYCCSPYNAFCPNEIITAYLNVMASAEVPQNHSFLSLKQVSAYWPDTGCQAVAALALKAHLSWSRTAHTGLLPSPGPMVLLGVEISCLCFHKLFAKSNVATSLGGPERFCLPVFGVFPREASLLPVCRDERVDTHQE